MGDVVDLYPTRPWADDRPGRNVYDLDPALPWQGVLLETVEASQECLIDLLDRHPSLRTDPAVADLLDGLEYAIDKWIAGETIAAPPDGAA